MAARFRFRLESLLKLRKSLEDEAQRELAREIATLRAVEQRIVDLQAEHSRTVETRRAAQGEIIEIDHWKAIERYLVVLELRIQKAHHERQEAEARVFQARQALAKAHQAHLTLVRLKERRKEVHDLEVLRQETLALDEMAVLRNRFNTRAQSFSLVEVNP